MQLFNTSIHNAVSRYLYENRLISPTGFESSSTYVLAYVDRRKMEAILADIADITHWAIASVTYVNMG